MFKLLGFVIFSAAIVGTHQQSPYHEKSLQHPYGSLGLKNSINFGGIGGLHNSPYKLVKPQSSPFRSQPQYQAYPVKALMTYDSPAVVRPSASSSQSSPANNLRLDSSRNGEDGGRSPYASTPYKALYKTQQGSLYTSTSPLRGNGGKPSYYSEDDKSPASSHPSEFEGSKDEGPSWQPYTYPNSPTQLQENKAYPTPKPVEYAEQSEEPSDEPQELNYPPSPYKATRDSPYQNSLRDAYPYSSSKNNNAAPYQRPRPEEVEYTPSLSFNPTSGGRIQGIQGDYAPDHHDQGSHQFPSPPPFMSHSTPQFDDFGPPEASPQSVSSPPFHSTFSSNGPGPTFSRGPHGGFRDFHPSSSHSPFRASRLAPSYAIGGGGGGRSPMGEYDYPPSPFPPRSSPHRFYM